MTGADDYLGKVHGLLIGLESTLTKSEIVEVWHLVDHGEPAEGVRALAWIISDRRIRISTVVLEQIRTLTEAMIDPRDMPHGLDQLVK